MGYDWPMSISERPLLQKVEGSMCFFIDGSSAEVDAIIFCTGYRYHYPYMEENLRLKTRNVYYPPNLYKGLLWMGPKGDGNQNGDGKLLYIGMSDLFYTFTLFDVEAHWAVKYIMGQIKVVEKGDMEQDWKQWVARLNKVESDLGLIGFQGAHIKDMSADSGYPYDVNVYDMFEGWYKDKREPNHGIMTYRDKSFTSKYTGTKAPLPVQPFMEAFDDSLECFVNGDHQQGD
ncbi:hypothetical protein CAPTEDRAFT_213062 [Capitella teleta]|uniref:Flavin-containing monooxygenase n=1 Tax=Capitella teleta TaxID=283909 RepID=R7TK26_CAPTE|nr:hypothetical protein CAPTEDRAFT_213062 [Capitella teleta]|eukprot:ELT93817.1 hypothetical protein CAPTEDRAFT_213062 [Capitella teleta]